MRKTYKPLSRAEQTSQVYKKKTLAVTDELNIRKDEDNMDNVDEYWTTAASVIGNRTIDSIDDTIVSGQSDTLFNLKNIRQSIKGSKDSGKKRLTLRLGDEDELAPAKHSNSINFSAADDDGDEVTATAIRENGGKATPKNTALSTHSQADAEQEDVVENVTEKQYQTTTAKQASKKEIKDSQKNDQLYEKPYNVRKEAPKKAINKKPTENGRQPELIKTDLLQKRSVPSDCGYEAEDKVKKAIPNFPVYKYIPASPKEGRNEKPVEFENDEEGNDMSHQTAEFGVSGDEVSFQSVSTETKGIEASSKHMARNMKVYKSAKAESARKASGKAAIAKSMNSNFQVTRSAAGKTVRSKSTPPRSANHKKTAKASTKKSSDSSIGEIISVNMYAERNKIKGLVCTTEIDTAVMDLDHMAYTKEEVAEKAFSVFVIKGILELIVEGKKGLMKKGDATVVSEGCTYAMSSLSKNGTVVFLSYAL